MNSDGGNTSCKCAVEDGEEAVAALLRVVQPPAHFDRHRDVSRNRFACPEDNLQGDLGLAQMETAAAPPEHFLHRAAEVDVDHVKSSFNQLQCSGGELFRF